MMDKVKITQEQADKIEDYKNLEYGVYDFLHDLSLNHITKWQGNSAEDQEEMLKMMRAFVSDYEIKKEYEVGDWVAHLDGSNIYPIGNAKVVEVHSFKKAKYGNDYVQHGAKGEWGTPVNLLRHATPEEIAKEKDRRKWTTIDREIGEFKDGDLGITHLGQWFDGVDQLEKMYRENRLEGFYPAGTFVDLLDKRELS